MQLFFDKHKDLLQSAMQVLCLFILFTFFGACQKPVSEDNLKLNLQEDWYFRQSGVQGAWLPAKVPGTVHTDLVQNKVIHDPYYRFNEDSIQWIERENWEYQKTIHCTKAYLANDHVELVFEGLDTYANIVINGEVVGQTDNMHKLYRFDAKPYLHEGENVLNVVFRSPSVTGEEKLSNYPYLLPTIAEQAEIGKQTAPFTRKASYHYGWDWAPRLVTMGIWRPVYLEAWNTFKLRDVFYSVRALESDKALVKATFEIESNTEQALLLSVASEDNTNELASKHIMVKEGLHSYVLDLKIANPKLWWANGMGDPYLYRLTGQIKSKQKIEERTVDFGIRTIKLVQEQDDFGESFKFQLNGKDIFIKGANWVPGDMFIPNVTEHRYKWLVESAKETNMNMLRVWGGAIYENEAFYKLCDKNGIMVWQDFMFACMHYPGTKDFLKSVQEEAVYNVKRLRNHPSIALWCGNNEIEEGWEPWRWSEKYKYSKEDSTKIYNDYEKIFYDILPNVIGNHDETKPYWASSPSAKQGKSGIRYIQNNRSGDRHYWGVWFGNIPFETFYENTGRFMSEYGFQSFPEIKTLRKVAEAQDMAFDSPLMSRRQRSFPGNIRMQEVMDFYYKRPKDFESFIYLSQLNQAEGIKKAINFHRKSKPMNMGTIYWQLNDVWPTMSWSSIDYFGNWKALQYFVKKANSDVAFVPIQQNDHLSLHMVSDRLKDTNIESTIRIKNLKGEALSVINKEYILPSNSAISIMEPQLVTEFLRSNKIKEHSNNLVLELELQEAGKPIFKDRHYFVPVKDLALIKPELEMSWEVHDNNYNIKITSKHFAKNVGVFSEVLNGRFSDNYFDMMPGETKRIQFIPIEDDGSITKNSFSLTSVWNANN
ncbi:glycoside hydrolase family 2 protein [Seonamhaeicola sp.]|uniref:beta-mannosidase n=1 Tax=Seonamhaeicola sp. TaxID=1912245 RepID=UPI0026037571|nr:glycoside hydrolase family 2 protein [Seonamhaeicola sp.]